MRSNLASGAGIHLCFSAVHDFPCSSISNVDVNTVMSSANQPSNMPRVWGVQALIQSLWWIQFNETPQCRGKWEYSFDLFTSLLINTANVWKAHDNSARRGLKYSYCFIQRKSLFWCDFVNVSRLLMALWAYSFILGRHTVIKDCDGRIENQEYKLNRAHRQKNGVKANAIEASMCKTWRFLISPFLCP